MTRTTIYMDSRLYRAAKVKSAVTSRSLSAIVNEALLLSLREDEADLSAFEKRRHEASRPSADHYHSIGGHRDLAAESTVRSAVARRPGARLTPVVCSKA